MSVDENGNVSEKRKDAEMFVQHLEEFFDALFDARNIKRGEDAHVMGQVADTLVEKRTAIVKYLAGL